MITYMFLRWQASHQMLYMCYIIYSLCGGRSGLLKAWSWDQRHQYHLGTC